jgi:hypothetical protein
MVGAIEVDRSDLHVEGTVRLVAAVTESPCNLTGVRIEGEDLFCAKAVAAKSSEQGIKTERI